MTYLQIAVEGGIPCLILFLVFFARGFLNIRKLSKCKGLTPELKLLIGALNSVLVGFIIGALFSPEAYQFFPFFAVAYTSALLAYVQRNDRASIGRSSVELKKPDPQFSATFVNQARVPVNP